MVDHIKFRRSAFHSIPFQEYLKRFRIRQIECTCSHFEIISFTQLAVAEEIPAFVSTFIRKWIPLSADRQNCVQTKAILVQALNLVSKSLLRGKMLSVLTRTVIKS